LLYYFILLWTYILILQLCKYDFLFATHTPIDEIPEKYNISIIYKNMSVYVILIKSSEGVEFLPNCFNKYNDALAAVKRKYNGIPKADGTYVPNWDDSFYEEDGDRVDVPIQDRLNKVDVREGHKSIREDPADPELLDPNLTELYIENGINITIRKFILPPRPKRNAAAGGGNTRRRHRKRNTKNSKRTFRLSRFY